VSDAFLCLSVVTKNIVWNMPCNIVRSQPKRKRKGRWERVVGKAGKKKRNIKGRDAKAGREAGKVTPEGEGKQEDK
jgi:hypothetical protein